MGFLNTTAQFDPSTLFQEGDGRWYALNAQGNPVLVYSSPAQAAADGVSQGQNAQKTAQMIEQIKAAADTSGSDFSLSGLGSALKEAAPGIGIIAGAGALGGAFGGLGGLGSASEGAGLYADQMASYGMGEGLAGASTAADSWDFGAGGGFSPSATSGGAVYPGEFGGEATGFGSTPAPIDPATGLPQVWNPANSSALPGGFNAGSSLYNATGGLLGKAGASTLGGAASAGSALSRLLGGNASTGDYASILGNLGAGALDAYGANKQAETLKDLSNQYMALGAPSRDRYNASFAPGFTMANDPGYTDALNQASTATLHGLSVKGNPADSPNAWAQSLSDLNSKFAYPALQDYRNTNANTGGFGAFNAAAPGAAASAAGAQSNIYNVAGKTLSNITNPPTDYSGLMKLLGNNSNIFGIG